MTIHQDLPHCEMMPGGTRLCFSRFNEGSDLLDLGLPLLLELHGKPEDIFVLNFGQWHHEEPAYRCVHYVAAAAARPADAATLC